VAEPFNAMTVNRVCRACNHGWMNDLELAARPTLTSLIRGEALSYDADAARTLATWVAKTCLMAEFTHPESNATPSAHYRWLFERREPPPLMRIWAAPNCGPDWALRMEHVAALYGDPVSGEVDRPYDAHSPTIGLGHVVFCVIGRMDERFPTPPIEDIPPFSAARLWPDPHSCDWTLDAPLYDESAWLLSDAFRLWMEPGDEFLLRLMGLAL
jgi:hypothetical protein